MQVYHSRPWKRYQQFTMKSYSGWVGLLNHKLCIEEVITAWVIKTQSIRCYSIFDRELVSGSYKRLLFLRSCQLLFRRNFIFPVFFWKSSFVQNFQFSPYHYHSLPLSFITLHYHPSLPFITLNYPALPSITLHYPALSTLSQLLFSSLSTPFQLPLNFP